MNPVHDRERNGLPQEPSKNTPQESWAPRHEDLPHLQDSYNRNVRHWGPYYITAFILVVVGFGMAIGSFFLQSIYKDMSLTYNLGPTTQGQTDYCSIDCSGVTDAIVAELYDDVSIQIDQASGYYYEWHMSGTYWREKMLQVLYDHYGGSSHYTCTNTAGGGYEISLDYDEGLNLTATYTVDCSSQKIQFNGGTSYTAGAFYVKVKGGSELIKAGDHDYNQIGRAASITLVIFTFLAVVMALPVVIMMSLASRDPTYILRRGCSCCGCCSCCVASSVRQLIAAAIAFLTIVVFLIVVVPLGIGCGVITNALDSCSSCTAYYCRTNKCNGITAMGMTGGHIAFYVIMLVTQLVALALMCAGYAQHIPN